MICFRKLAFRPPPWPDGGFTYASHRGSPCQVRWFRSKKARKVIAFIAADVGICLI